jgi:hypothetical protein
VAHHLGGGGDFEAPAEIGVLALAEANQGAARWRIRSQNSGADELHRKRVCALPLAKELRADRCAAAKGEHRIRKTVRR